MHRRAAGQGKRRAWTLLLHLACGAILLGLPLTARSQTPDSTPFLRVETGVHQSVINRTILLPDGLAVATVSDDKSARIWSVNGLKPLGIIRPPMGLGDDGALTAEAVSGHRLVLGGRIRFNGQFAVQFYRLPDLKFIGHLSDLPAPVSALKFSQDGHTLAIGLVGGRGLAFYDMTNGKLIDADNAYGGQVQWIDTDSNGRTVATGEDGRIRLYGPSHAKLVPDVVLPNGADAYAAVFSPDGRFIAAGVQNSPTVWLLDAATLHPVRSFVGAPQRTGGFNVVAFTPDGQSLLGAGTYKASATSPRLMRRWALDGHGATEFAVGGDTVTDLVALPQATVVSDAIPTLAELDNNGGVIAARTSNQMNFRDAGIAGFAVSADGATVELPLAGNEPVLFDVAHRALLLPSQGPTMSRPIQVGLAVQITQWRNTKTPMLNGQPVTLEKDEESLSAATALNGSGAAIGTNFFVRYVRRDGSLWKASVPAPAWAVNVSPNGRLVIAGLGDGTVRWYDAATGNELLIFYLDPSSRQWVLSTPEGFFDHDQASPGRTDGRNLVGYRINEGETSRFVEVGQFYPVYYRPDLVGLALRTDPAARQAISNARENKGTPRAVIDRGLPASITLLDACGRPADSNASVCNRASDTTSPPDHPGFRLATTNSTLLVRFHLSNPGGQPGRAAIFRDAAAISPALFTADEDDHNLTQVAAIPLGDGENKIRLLPVSSNGEVEGSDAAAIEFKVWHTPIPKAGVAASGSKADPPRRALYLLSVGVSKFAQPELDLDNASNDARAVAVLMGTPDPPLYDDAKVVTLLDEQATVTKISAALKSIADQAKPDDLVVIFFAGHGQEVDGRYYFAPADLGTRNADLYKRALAGGVSGTAAIDELFRTEGLGPSQLLPLVQALTATRVAVVLDTCYSGSLASQDAVIQRDANTTVTNALGHATGRFVLSSATTLALDSSNTSAEIPQDGHGHGLFTSFLLEALAGRGDVARSGLVDIVQLATFTIANVKKATASLPRKQEPTFFFAGNDFFAVHTDVLSQ